MTQEDRRRLEKIVSKLSIETHNTILQREKTLVRTIIFERAIMIMGENIQETSKILQLKNKEFIY